MCENEEPTKSGKGEKETAVGVSKVSSSAGASLKPGPCQLLGYILAGVVSHRAADFDRLTF